MSGGFNPFAKIVGVGCHGQNIEVTNPLFSVASNPPAHQFEGETIGLILLELSKSLANRPARTVKTIN